MRASDIDKYSRYNTNNFIGYVDFYKISIKCQQKTPTGKILYRALLFHIHGGGKVSLDSNMKKSGRSDPFPEGTECTPALN